MVDGKSFLWACTGLGAVLASVAAPAVSAAPPQAVATSAWQVDYGDQRCVASRRFTVGKAPVVFGIEPFPDEQGFRMLFRIEPGNSAYEVGWSRAQVLVNGRQIADSVTAWPGTQDGLLLIASTASDGGNAPTLLGDVKDVRIENERLSAAIPLSGMARVGKLLKDCNAGLLESWGFSKPDQARLATWPKLTSPMQTLFNPNDYPADAIRQGQQGEVRVRALVTPDGRATDCKLRDSSGSASLDAATCEGVVKRGRFEPARDKSGRPMAAPVTQSVRWIMPS